MEPLEHSSSWLMGYFQYSTYTQCISMRRRQQSGRYSAPALPTTTAPPQNVPLSPLMRLVAPRVAAAALDGGRSWWMGRRMVHHRQRQKWARITGPKLSAQESFSTQRHGGKPKEGNPRMQRIGKERWVALRIKIKRKPRLELQVKIFNWFLPATAFDCVFYFDY